MPKSKLPKVNFIRVNLLTEGRFKFVENEVLRENIAISTQYVAFLYSLTREYEISGSVVYSIYRNIIIHLASIVESLLNYKLQKLIQEGKVSYKKIMKKGVKHRNRKILYEVSSEEKVVGVVEKTFQTKLNNETHFVEINQASRKCGLINQDLWKKVDKLRENRNKIHLIALKNRGDDFFEKSELEEAFLITKEVIERVRNFK